MKRHIALLFLATTWSYAQTCPVTVNGYLPTEMNITVYWHNASDKPVQSARFRAYNMSVGDRQELLYAFDKNRVKPLKPKANARDVFDDAESKSRTGGVWVEKVQFADGTVWQDDGSKSCSFDKTK